MARLFCFGLGFSALTLARQLSGEGWTIAGTCRTQGKCDKLSTEGINAFCFDGSAALGNDAADALAQSDHLLISIPPGAAGDPVIKQAAQQIQAAGGGMRWAGYLSTTGVYGDTGGAEVTENSPLVPTSPRGEYRVAAEQAWLDLSAACGIPMHVFRLAGIYGPGRSVLDQLRHGNARRVDKADHRFSRIHVEDIAKVLRASMARPSAGTVYNVCDDEPAAQSDVVAYGADLIGETPPPAIPFEDASKSMSPMALTFWRDNRTVSNARIKDQLGVTLTYPTYREGLAETLKAGG